jgi:capsular polysaccharide biosynthesis protein
VSGHDDLRQAARTGQRRGLARQLDLRAYVERLTMPSIGAVLLVAIVGLLVAGLSAASLQRRDPAYESSQLLLIDQPAALALAPSGDLVAKLASLRFKYTSLLLADSVLEPAAEAVGLPAGALAGAVRASAPPESLLIRITARTSAAEPAPRIAEAIATSLAQYVADEQSALGVPEASRIELTAIRAASAAVQVEPSSGRSLSTGIVGGLVAAGLLYLALGALPSFSRRRPDAA